MYLINWMWLTVYVKGNYCKLEIDLFQRYCLQLFTKHGFINTFKVIGG
jgi:hypothetical protein